LCAKLLFCIANDGQLKNVCKKNWNIEGNIVLINNTDENTYKMANNKIFFIRLVFMVTAVFFIKRQIC